MDNKITIKFWSLDLRLAKELYKKIDNFIRKKQNLFLIKHIDTEIEFNSSE